ncbi:phage tail protein [Cohnella zeiphila]|uniref:Phage tail protein n=1 Tax=Cohnella zeiphila TaxID=2761120 RepID=A0A7X0ST27_9BACL|nr:phage tail protein [Cohnella zeiphila]MBB6735605.1 phage tail protein [Cohnella zeiphila]
MSDNAGDYVEAYGSFRFLVELEGVAVAGFSEVQGLEAETEMEEYREGGVNDHVHLLPRGIKHPRIVLRRGITTSPALWEWYDNYAQGSNPRARKDGSIILYKRDGEELCRWNFFKAYPVKWSGPSLNAMSSDTAIESVELVHGGLKTIFSRNS